MNIKFFIPMLVILTLYSCNNDQNNLAQKPLNNSKKNNAAILKTYPILDAKYIQSNKEKWQSFVVEQLVKQGFKKKRIEQHLKHKRIYFKPEIIAANLGFIKELNKNTKPGSSELVFVTGISSTQFLSIYGDFLNKISKRYKVPQEVILSILWVETKMGSFTGGYSVLNVYYNLALLQNPEVLIEVLKWLQSKYPDRDYFELIKKAGARSQWGLYQLRSLFLLSKRINLNLNYLFGSYAGAFGIPQFIPSSYLAYARDGNGDGVIDLFNMYDAIVSTANYLSRMGWKNHFKQSQFKAILSYNNSSDYLMKVMNHSKKIKNMIHPADRFPIFSQKIKAQLKKSKTPDQKEILSHDLNKVLLNMNNRNP